MMDDHVRSPKTGRHYRMTQRAANQAETRLAIARAAFELHNTVGPSQTTVSAIAEKAGVQRLTVYRHLPDEKAVFAACTAYALAEDPPPKPELWRSIRDPQSRLRKALKELYGYYRRRSRLLANLHRDKELPVVATALARRRDILAEGVTILAEGWPNRSAHRRRTLKASIGHALTFSTWQSLVEDQGLTESDAVALMLTFVAEAV